MFARLLILFLTIPILELFVFLLVGQRIGIPMTLAIIIFTAVLGSYLTKSQGLKAIAKYQESLAQGRLPHEAIIESLLILIAGALLITPGFLTDSIGFALLVPSVRAYIRGRVEKSLKERIQLAGQDVGAAGRTGSGPQGRGPQVITVEAVVVERTTDRSRP